MKAVKVQYTVKEDYVATNKGNIEKVMHDLRAMNNPDLKYSSFLQDDGRTFVHLAFYPDEKTAEMVSNLESFVNFRKQLKESQPEVPPKAENLSLVASAWEYFD